MRWITRSSLGLAVSLLSLGLVHAVDLAHGQIGVGGEYGSGAVLDSDENGSGILLTAEYEFELVSSLTLAGRAQYYNYDWDNGESGFLKEEEEGSGVGVGAEVRWYVSDEAFKGFYLGGGLGAFVGEWEFRRSGIVREDESGEPVGEVHFALGWNFKTSSPFAVAPTFVVGNYFSGSPEAGLFAGIGVRFGWGL